MRAKAVFFDLDGTLIDTAPDFLAALNPLLIEEGINSLTLDESIKWWVSLGAQSFIEKATKLKASDPKFIYLKEKFLSKYEIEVGKHSLFFKDMQEVIEYLNLQHIAWGIVTNKPHRFTQNFLKNFYPSLKPICVVSGDTTPYSKPHPEPLLYAAKIVGINPKDCLYIGDHERDMIAADAAGMTSCLALWGYLQSRELALSWKANYYLENCLELLAYLRKIYG
ncbi:MAG: phosphoglycolate phosphatase-like, clustered with ubiquinone biosynthesis SAM-dependent [Francisellaceae bacterium]|nr:phosphoglycolate phosphatase-like, clustered with ubiquinone biosynthesis SAM-dependent [Francisellaceae bacterium]